MYCTGAVLWSPSFSLASDTPTLATSVTAGVTFTVSGGVKTAQIGGSGVGIISAYDVTAYGSPSDIKLKENITLLANGLSMIERLNGYSFNYKGKTDRMIGVIAQELEAVAPELVYETESLETGETIKAVRYAQITAILIEAVKELSAEVKELKKKLGE